MVGDKCAPTITSSFVVLKNKSDLSTSFHNLLFHLGLGIQELTE